MILYDYFINFLEGLLLSSFVAYYFNIKNKIKFIILVTAICFLEISISNSINLFDYLLIFIVIITLFISLIICKNELYFDKIVVCSMAGIFLFLANLLSMLITTIIFKINSTDIYSSNIYYCFCTIVSKSILGCFFVLICIFKSKFKNTLTIKNGWSILLLCFTIEYMIVILLEILLTNNLNNGMAISLIFALIIICSLFLFIFRTMQIDNENKLRYELELQKNEYRLENYSKIQFISNEITIAEHRMTYILVQIKNLIDTNQYDVARSTLEKYINNTKKLSPIINTNNPYFDFVISKKITEYKQENIFLKTTLFMFENDLFNNKIFCDLITEILDVFKSKLIDDKYLSLEILQETSNIIIKFTGVLKNMKIDEELLKKIKYFSNDFSIDDINKIYILKIVIEI